MDLIPITIIAFLLIVGILFVIWGISFKLKSNKLTKNCVDKRDGVLIKIEEIEIHHATDTHRWHTTKSYVPTYEYEVSGKRYTIKGTNGSGFQIGDIVKICFNPNNPEESYIEGYSFIIWIVLVIIGIFIISISSFIYLFMKWVS